jgi:DNA-binding NarL/FixJ family response regulator
VIARLLDLGSAAHVPTSLLDALVARGVAWLWTDAVDQARTDLQAILARARAGEPVQYVSQAIAYLSEACYRAGAFDEAITYGELACVMAEEAGRGWDLAFVHAIVAYPRAARGEFVEATAHVQTAMAAARSFGVSAALAYAHSAAAALAQAQGDLAALAATTTSHEPLPELGVVPVGPVHAEALLGMGQLSEADKALRSYERRAATLRRDSAIAAAARVRIALETTRGRFQAAHAAFRNGIAAVAKAGPLLRGRLHAAYGAALAAAGDREQARRQLGAAAEILTSIGAQPYLARVHVELSGLGTRAHTLAPRLTAREATVAHLVAQGLSNQDVAAQLVVSVKTVEYHLGHVYAKLGVRSRTQLAAWVTGGRHSTSS